MQCTYMTCCSWVHELKLNCAARDYELKDTHSHSNTPVSYYIQYMQDEPKLTRSQSFVRYTRGEMTCAIADNHEQLIHKASCKFVQNMEIEKEHEHTLKMCQARTRIWERSTRTCALHSDRALGTDREVMIIVNARR